MIWFLSDPARVAREQAAVGALAAEYDWLTDIDWGFDASARLKLDFAITVGGERFSLRMTYPKLFPHTPPDVTTVDPDKRVSEHQYLGGNLCLQYRPDNWQSAITGADMIRSAHELFSTERPPEGPPREVQSAHRQTEGQAFRWKSLRFLVTGDLNELLPRLNEGAALSAEVRLSTHAQCTTASVGKIRLEDGTDWSPHGQPKLGTAYRGVIARIPTSELAVLAADADGTLAGAARDRIAETMGLTEYADREFLLATDGKTILLWWQLSAAKNDITTFSSLMIEAVGGRRLSDGYEGLTGKKVAVIGCGSAGSKIAVSLARSGVGSFVLIDDDLFLRDNLVRHDLDWRSVGEHKVDGVLRRIRMVNPTAEVKVRRLSLTGQESAGSAASALDQVAECDVIVDATADADAFNLLASITMAAKKPMVWFEVFAGGIGGLVARHRPGKDQTPQLMRNAFGAWCRDQGVPWTEDEIGRYGARDGEGAVLVADDGDVSVIAAHATRMAADLLIEGDSFPHSMYVLSLRSGWLFSEPFEAYPIDVQFIPEAAAAPPDPAAITEGLSFIGELLGKASDEAATS